MIRLSGPLLKRLAIAFLTPIPLGYKFGHIRSAMCGRPVESLGHPVPWYTYPATQFLASKDFASKTVLEWGAGHSTLWWARRARSVTSFEADADWAAWLRTRVPPNVVIRRVAEDTSGADEFLSLQQFDLIVIDGLDRYQCAVKSRGHLREGGALLLDDSEGHWGHDGDYPIIRLFSSGGYQRIDFYGHAPGVFKPRCTSIFFQHRCFLFEGSTPPLRYDGRFNGHASA